MKVEDLTVAFLGDVLEDDFDDGELTVGTEVANEVVFDGFGSDGSSDDGGRSRFGFSRGGDEFPEG